MAVSPPPAPSSIDLSGLPPRVVEAAARVLALCREELRSEPRPEAPEEVELRVREATNEFARDVMGAVIENRDDGASRIERDGQSWFRVPDGTNPCRSVRKYPAHGRERFLTDTEFRRLGEVLGEAPTEGGVSVHAVAAIRLLMLTGCRKSEILSLQWTDIDLEAGELRLRESKTGPRAVPLSPPAAKVLAELPRVPGNPWVIPGQKPDTHMTNLDDPWRIVRERAGVENVRIHDCRHSFASRALALGESLPVIAKLLGHSQIQTTARYAHLARDSVNASAARVAASIAEDFLTGGSATAKLPGRQGTDSSG